MAHQSTWKMRLSIFCVFLVIASSVYTVNGAEGADSEGDTTETVHQKVEDVSDDEPIDEDEEDMKFADMEEGIKDSDIRVTKEKKEPPMPEGKGPQIPEGVDVEDGVLVLTEHNFDEVVFNADIILVEFYAPWCGHCKTLAPEYASAALTFADMKSEILLGKVDATEHKALAERFSVSGYPTLYFWKEGQRYDYDGERTQNDIMEYMIERAKPDWKPPPEAVITLTAENFAEVVNNKELILVEFYAPWCGHCKKFAPEYEKAAQVLKTMKPAVPLAKVDATVETDLANRFDVSGYPTLKMFRKGVVYDYNGGRDQKSVIEYMVKQSGEGSKELKTKAMLQSFMKADDVTVIGFFDGPDDARYDVFKDASNELRDDYALGHTFNTDLMDAYKVNSGSLVVFNAERFYTKYEPKWHTQELTEDTLRKDVVRFVSRKKVPLVGHMNLTHKEKRYKDMRPLVLVFYFIDFSFDYREATQLWRNKIADIANDYKDFTFAVANEEEHEDLFKEFGFDDSGEEMNIGIIDRKEKKFPMEPMEEFDSDAIREFLDNFKSGELKPRMKSKAPPKKQGVVKTVVGKTFQKVVMDESKDVLIELYTPWCGHCKKLEPVYKELAKKYKNDKNLVIAKMDATANDAPEEYAASGFPTIYFSPSNKKKNPIKFEGANRELEDLESFIRNHATVSTSFKKDGKEEL